jgi:endo-1,4-beta-xylanase
MRRSVGLVVLLALIAGGATACVEPAPPPQPPDCDEPICPLAEVARDRGVRVGAAIEAYHVTEGSADADAIRRHFTSVTAENALKLSVLRPTPTTWNWGPADTIVDVARANSLTVRGHTLAWVNESGNQNGLPQWMRDLTDPAAFRAAVLDSVAEVVGRYRGRVDRWDVVNEPFEYPFGVRAPSVFDRMGPDYIAELFTAAHAADPDATLWLNEIFTETFPAKADALVGLVRSLRERGVPIHGVGLQTHLILSPAAPEPGSVSRLVTRLRDLGVEVAITEMDVPLGPARSERAQVDTYRQVVDECLRSGCSEITVWGLGDGDTWLDSPAQRRGNPLLAAFFSLPSRPLLLDEDLRPKAAYSAVVDAIERTPPRS